MDASHVLHAAKLKAVLSFAAVDISIEQKPVNYIRRTSYVLTISANKLQG